SLPSSPLVSTPPCPLFPYLLLFTDTAPPEISTLSLQRRSSDLELLIKGLVSNVNKVVDDSTNEPLPWHMDDVGLTVVLPDKEVDDLLSVIRVELEDELCIIPAFTVKERDGSWLITDDDLYDGRGFKDSGNYNTLAATTVRKTAFITNHTPGKVTLRFKGNVNDETRRYHVQVGEEMETVTGKRLLTST